MKEKAIKMIRLASNENALGASPLAQEVIRKNYQKIHLYPEYSPITLRTKLSQKLGIPLENIVLSAGSVDMIDMIIKIFVAFDEEVLTFENSFVAYGLAAQASNKKCMFAPLTDFTCDVDNLLPMINEKTKVIFIANPNNPTGTIISHKSLKKLLSHVSPDVMVVSDEAYYEYVTDKSYPDTMKLRKEYPNLVILRTFSKIYGLAGLRVGYAIGNEDFVSVALENSLPFRINLLGARAAYVALDDDDFIYVSANFNVAERSFLYDEFDSLGYNVIPSQGNFIYMYFEEHNEKEMIFKKLEKAGILVCNLDVFGQKNALRISVGTNVANRKMIECLKR